MNLNPLPGMNSIATLTAAEVSELPQASTDWGPISSTTGILVMSDEGRLVESDNLSGFSLGPC